MNASAAEHLVGCDVIDSKGRRIGSVSRVYVDDRTGHPGWIAVRARRSGNRGHLVPVRDSYLTVDNDLVVCVDKGVVENAPRVQDETALHPDQQQALIDYYSQVMPASAGTSGYGTGWDAKGGMTMRR